MLFFVFSFVGPGAEEYGGHALLETLSIHTYTRMNTGTSNSSNTTTEFTYHTML
jgi:hypothetical protein